MRRREFITLVGTVALASPLKVRAQQATMPVVGFLSTRSADDSARLVTAFGHGLADVGYVEGRNVKIEYRWAQGQFNRLPALAAELADVHVAVIAAVGGAQSGIAAKVTTGTIPIVFGMGEDPVIEGLVSSFNRPGANITGSTFFTALLGAKRLGLLIELVPKAKVFGLLVNPNSSQGQTQTRDVQKAAHGLDLQLVMLDGGTDDAIDGAFASLAQKQIDALLVGADPFFDIRRDRLIALVAQHKTPAVYQFREYALAGGLMSYGASASDNYLQVGKYVGQILNGAKPADLPIMQPTKFEMVINLKTAKALALALPPSLLARADEVIE
jgi:putative tryptophan/tyrosine transport system substrate-binding protein